MRTDRPGRPGARNNPSPRSPRERPSGDLLYGRNGVSEALRGRRTPKRLYVASGIKEDQRVRELLDAAARRGVPIERIQRNELDEMTAGANHQGVALAASAYPYAAFEEIARRPGTVIVLDHLQDPQNLGTLLRAAEAADVAGVVIPRDRAAEVTPAVVNASAGAVEHLLLAQQPNLVHALEELKETGRWALALDTGPDAGDLFSADLPLPAVLVVGAEGTGVSQRVRRACDLVVQIPMAGRVASLNAATAGSIALFELVRRQRSGA